MKGEAEGEVNVSVNYEVRIRSQVGVQFGIQEGNCDLLLTSQTWLRIERIGAVRGCRGSLPGRWGSRSPRQIPPAACCADSKSDTTADETPRLDRRECHVAPWVDFDTELSKLWHLRVHVGDAAAEEGTSLR